MITVVDSMMGSGKTSWIINQINEGKINENILYITPYLDEVERFQLCTLRRIYSPKNKGNGKLGNISKLLENQVDIASTHALFRMFDERCKKALKENDYTLILDETLSAVEPYTFQKKDDFRYLIDKEDIKVSDDGLIEWTGKELDTRFDDVRILAQNKCLFRVNDKFFLWHFPHEILSLFKNVYVLTYLFKGSIMKYYFDLYQIKYDVKSILNENGKYTLTEHTEPDKGNIRERLRIYEGNLNYNIPQTDKTFSKSFSTSQYHRKEMEALQRNFFNFSHNIVHANSGETIWTTFESCKSLLSGKGYTRGFVACNCRATNDFQNATYLMYGINWFPNPEIESFFQQRGIKVDKDAIALSNMLQWIWRSNIRVSESEKIVNIYIPSKRMRKLMINWLNG